MSGSNKRYTRILSHNFIGMKKHAYILTLLLIFVSRSVDARMVTFGAGWNLIAVDGVVDYFPLQLFDEDHSRYALGKIGSGGWELFEENGDNAMKTQQVVWVELQQELESITAETEAADYSELSEGWNLISPGGSRTLDALYHTIQSETANLNVERIYTHSVDSGWSSYDYARQTGDLQYLNGYNGVWVYLVNPDYVADISTIDMQLSEQIATTDLTGSPYAGRELKEITDPLPQLGKKLFFSTALSGTSDVACASCHHPLLGGGDDLPLSVGVDAFIPTVLGPGRVHQGDLSLDPQADGGPNVGRNSPTTFNVSLYERSLFWDGRVQVVEQGIDTPESPAESADVGAGDDLLSTQSMFPVVSTHEMRGRTGTLFTQQADEARATLALRLRESSSWLSEFQQGFGDLNATADEMITYRNIAAALSAYQQTQVFVNSPWNAYLGGDLDAISTEAKLGALLFFKPIEEGGFDCDKCHSGDFFTDEKYYLLAVPQLGRGQKNSGVDFGRSSVTGKDEDDYKFRTPSLLNVEVTGPWGHDGAFVALEDALAYQSSIESSSEQYDYTLAELKQFDVVEVDAGRNQINTLLAVEKFMQLNEDEKPLQKNITKQDVSYLVSFLKSLTDPCVKEVNCLAPWIATDPVDNPDGNLLVATFSSFAMQPFISVVGTIEGEENNNENTVIDGFSNVSLEAGITYPLSTITSTAATELESGGVAVADYDEDGWLDFFVGHGKNGAGLLFKNNQQGGFLNETQLSGIETSQRARGGLFVDINGNGLEDLIVSEGQPDNIKVFRNSGSGYFEEITESTGLAQSGNTFSLAASDYDRDGDMDLTMGHWGKRPNSDRYTGYLWENRGAIFEDVTTVLPIPATKKTTIFVDPKEEEYLFTINFSDLNGDHIDDMVVSGDFKNSHYYIGSEEGLFTLMDSAVLTDENGMGAALGDYDNDGDIDWFVTSVWNENPDFGLSAIGGSGNRLYNNSGAGLFSDVTEVAGVREGHWGWGACFSDFDNDGDLDLFHVNGFGDNDSPDDGVLTDYLNDPARFYDNNGDGSFTERASELGMSHTGQGRGVSCWDYDRDGDIDILIANNGRSPSLFRNDRITGNHYVHITLNGLPGNAHGVGAKVWVESQGNTQLREIRLGSNYLSNNPTIAYFGLGDSVLIDSIRVEWPGTPNSVTTERLNVSVDQMITLQHPQL
jgi:enediyne biosynthesis protein E4